MNLEQKFNKPELSVIIVNYNSGTYAIDCINALFLQIDIQFEVIVVDNASNDKSAELLINNFVDRIKFVPSDENLGFAKANNLAAKISNGTFLLLLNPDTVLIQSNTLRSLVDELNSNPHIGLLSPLIDEPRKNKQVYPRYRYPSTHHLKFTETFKKLPGKIAWVLGACMLIKRSVFEEIGGFDPDYFLYGEDTDICLKLRLAKYEIGFIENVKIMHVGGASEFGSHTFEKWLRKKRGLYLFLTKHLDTRDVIRIAKAETLKSKIYLLGLQFTYLFNLNKTSEFYLNQQKDKRHRLQATIIAATESIDLAKKQKITR